jgi:hypothetical protein
MSLKAPRATSSIQPPLLLSVVALHQDMEETVSQSWTNFFEFHTSRINSGRFPYISSAEIAGK